MFYSVYCCFANILRKAGALSKLGLSYEHTNSIGLLIWAYKAYISRKPIWLSMPIFPWLVYWILYLTLNKSLRPSVDSRIEPLDLFGHFIVTTFRYTNPPYSKSYLTNRAMLTQSNACAILSLSLAALSRFQYVNCLNCLATWHSRSSSSLNVLRGSTITMPEKLIESLWNYLNYLIRWEFLSDLLNTKPS